MRIVIENHIANYPHRPSNKQQKATLGTRNYHFDSNVHPPLSLPPFFYIYR